MSSYKKIILKNKFLDFRLNTENGAITTIDNVSKTIWRSGPRHSGWMKEKDKYGINAFGVYHVFQIGISHIVKTQITRHDPNEATVRLHFKHPKLPLLIIDCTYRISMNELTVELNPVKDLKGKYIADLYYPPFFGTKDPDSYFVVPKMQGFILPCNTKEKLDLRLDTYGTLSLTMPWFGLLKNDAGMIAIFETPFDSGVRILTEGGIAAPFFQFSCGRLSYKRKIKYVFLNKTNHVGIAKEYRNYVIKSGQFKSLNQKIKENKNVGKLLGSSEISFSICNDHVKELFAKNVQTFGQVAEKVKTLKRSGIRKALIHVDGWGRSGYDSEHPYILPPCKEAGGWEGLKKLSHIVDKAGYLFCLHDNYMLANYNAKRFSKDDMYLDILGNTAYESVWCGGETTIMCSKIGRKFAKKNFSALMKKIKLTASYCDQTSILSPYECHNKAHLLSRAEDIKERLKLLSYVRSLGIVLSSEGASDWALPQLDFVYYNPYLEEGIPCPLHSIVYHDAIVTPWSISKESMVYEYGLWSILTEAREESFLRAFLHGGVLCLYEDIRKSDLSTIKLIQDFHGEVGKEAMVNHKYLSSDGRIQRTTFGNNVIVTVNYDKRKMFIRNSHFLLLVSRIS